MVLTGYHVLSESDYAWLTVEINKIATECCEGRIVSVSDGDIL